MEMEVVMPSPAVDFNFDSASTSPYITAPSSPQRFGTFFYSAPTSPTRTSAFRHDFHDGETLSATGSSVPFNWEHKPGISKPIESHVSTAASSNYGDAEQDLEDDVDFAFDFSGQLERGSLSADELFDGGKIKPLKPPPRFQYDHQNKPLDSPKSPRSPKRFIKEAFSPRHRKRDNSDSDPFAAALEQTRKESVPDEKRGRERTISNPSQSSPISRHKPTRSLSPFRVSDLLLEPDPNHEPEKNPSNNSSMSAFASFWYNKKWKIKDLLLFRSASESRATDKEQMKKYAVLKKTRREEVKNSSFRSIDSGGSGSSRRRPGPPVSAHELHYTVNRAVSEEMKRRTSLPYKQGLLGCLGFHPTVPDISKGLGPTGSMSRR